MGAAAQKWWTKRGTNARDSVVIYNVCAFSLFSNIPVTKLAKQQSQTQARVILSLTKDFQVWWRNLVHEGSLWRVKSLGELKFLEWDRAMMCSYPEEHYCKQV